MRVNTSTYYFSHRREPSGKGWWFFKIRYDSGGCGQFLAKSGLLYSKALKAAKEYAKAGPSAWEIEVLP